jgi:molybdopterin/thiamine biosynthesis adenylyltransferase
LHGDRIRLGGSVYGIAAEVIDRSGAIWTMLNAADGTRSSQQIAEHVVSEHPQETSDTVLRGLDQFTSAGYLEDAAAPDPPELSPREKERYDRSRQFYRWLDLTSRTTSWEPQMRLRETRVVLLGLGGTGGVAALALAASGVGHLHCVDHDSVELSNLNRQIMYTENSVGKAKVSVSVERLRQLNSDIEVTGERVQVSSQADLGQLVSGHDLLVLCADHPGMMRTWANRACLEQDTPWVDAGYHGPLVGATAYVPGRGPCYECAWQAEYDLKRQDDPNQTYSAERGSSSAVTAASAGLSGYLAAHLASAVITGIPRVEPGQMQGINLMTADHHVLIANVPHPKCPAACDASLTATVGGAR